MSNIEMFIQQVDNAVRQHYLDSGENPEESEIRQKYEQFYDLFSIPYPQEATALNKRELIDTLIEKYDLTIQRYLGFAYQDEDTRPWLNEVETDIEWFYWERYKQYLLRTKKWSPVAVSAIDKDTRATLDLMANPVEESRFERRGLVVAPVQSGKTANYTGLICRAADAGYKIIIVMAGVHNVLRNQTQKRLEEGFTGFNIVEQQEIRLVGVGVKDAARRPVACTSREADFNKQRASGLKGVQTGHTTEPWLFVIKKNSNSLKQVYEWLKDNASRNDSLLLIDDEADNASINGKYKREEREKEPTRINGQIRKMLNIFSRSCYVGYTATPFANILIDPDNDVEGYGQDIFPRSFIYTLEESSDYFGASKVFDDYDDKYQEHLRYIDDIETVLPPKHKSSDWCTRLPDSLKSAVRTFVVATAIRHVRGDANEHSTMMVNVSPYKTPQKSVAGLVRNYLDELRNAVKAYSSLPADQAVASSRDLFQLQATWEHEYKEGTVETWDDIQGKLFESIRSMHVVSINTDSNDILDYDRQVEHVIAVGGYRLSRGLTLEGLVVSYYSRNAKAYDALMQMARWFGYRPGYKDLCRIWMSREAGGWYKFVADSTDSLFDDLRNMRQVSRTPKNYGLRIRQSPDALTVTARNKMGTGQRVPAPIDLNNGFTETVTFVRDRGVREANYAAAVELLERLSLLPDENAASEKYLFSHVPSNNIVGFLEAFRNDDTYSAGSQVRPILNYIEDRMSDGELTEWDVYVAHGKASSKDVVALPGLGNIPREQRYPGTNTSNETLFVGEKRRLASRDVEKEGLSAREISLAEQAFKRDHPTKKHCSGKYYREQRKHPLLVLHPVSIKFSEDQVEDYRNEGSSALKLPTHWESWEHHEEVMGWSVSFPYTTKQARLVDFILNGTAIEGEFSTEDSDDDYEDD